MFSWRWGDIVESYLISDAEHLNFGSASYELCDLGYGFPIYEVGWGRGLKTVISQRLSYWKDGDGDSNSKAPATQRARERWGYDTAGESWPRQDKGTHGPDRAASSAVRPRLKLRLSLG